MRPRPEGGHASARVPPGPEHAAARSARGRQPFKYENAPLTTPVVNDIWVGTRPTPRPERPTERASSKARRPTHPGWSGVPRREAQEATHPPHECRPTAGADRRGAPDGLVTLTQANCAGEISVGKPPSSDRRSTAGVCLTGGAAATRHGAPRGATESPPRSRDRRPLINVDQLVGEGGNALGPGRGRNSH